jgi:hypothetical protein
MECIVKGRTRCKELTSKNAIKINIMPKTKLRILTPKKNQRTHPTILQSPVSPMPSTQPNQTTSHPIIETITVRNPSAAIKP